MKKIVLPLVFLAFGVYGGAQPGMPARRPVAASFNHLVTSYAASAFRLSAGTPTAVYRSGWTIEPAAAFKTAFLIRPEATGELACDKQSLVFAGAEGYLSINRKRPADCLFAPLAADQKHGGRTKTVHKRQQALPRQADTSHKPGGSNFSEPEVVSGCDLYAYRY